MAAAAGVLDEAVKEYLVYRGFTSTLRHFELEKREDKDKGFKVSFPASITRYLPALEAAWFNVDVGPLQQL